AKARRFGLETVACPCSARRGSSGSSSRRSRPPSPSRRQFRRESRSLALRFATDSTRSTSPSSARTGRSCRGPTSRRHELSQEHLHLALRHLQHVGGPRRRLHAARGTRLGLV